jgi:acyl-CoA synthetase (AMP-forming)/AMP-acid ligase II
VGILLFAGWIAASVAVPAAVSSSSSGYALTATDAHFTATFPARPQRAARAVGTATVIAYTTTLPDRAVAVTYVALPASASFRFDGAINGAAASLPGAKIVSRNSLTYLGQPAEDATISSSAGFAQVRVVRFGSSAYILQAFGPSASSYTHDYNILLDSFHPLHP